MMLCHLLTSYFSAMVPSERSAAMLSLSDAELPVAFHCFVHSKYSSYFAGAVVLCCWN